MTVVMEVGTAELVSLARRDDQAAWNELVDRFTRLVWHVILGFRGLDPESQADIHQTTWLRLAEQLETIREPDRLGSWLATTARRECLGVLRARERELPVDEVLLGASDDELDRHLLTTERDAALWAAFRELDASKQALLRLLLAEPPFSYDEIAALLDMPRGTISKRRREALAALKKELTTRADRRGL